MDAARWRLRRILTFETNEFNVKLVCSNEEMAAESNDMDYAARLGWVFQQLADQGQSIALIVRYESALNRAK
jgi:hypothetical protein